MRVSHATRDQLNEISAQRGETVDETIRRGLDLIVREEWRRTADLDAWAASLDAEDQAELRAAVADLGGE